jgi:heme-degrading monooxygenase HmoA
MSAPVVNISIITPKPEHFSAFVALQLAQHHRLRDQVEGLIGARLFRSRDDRDVVLVSLFESEEAARRFSGDDRFRQHLARIQPLLERAVPGVYELAYEVGTI